MPTEPVAPAVPRLTYLRIKNYRALRDVEFRDLTPLTVLIGPNGSGKSTVLDALDFLAEAVRGNLVQAWEKRDRFRGMRTRGSEGDIEFEIELIIFGSLPTRYKIALYENKEAILIKNEEIRLMLNPVVKVAYKDEDSSKGAYNGVTPANAYRSDTNHVLTFIPASSSIIHSYNWNNYDAAKKTADNIHMQELWRVITSYRLLHLTDDHLKGYSDQGPREKLSPNGDNLPNVLYYLHLKHPEVLGRITRKLREWVPGLAEVLTEVTSDERLLLRFRDAPFEKPLPAQYMSGGTMRLAALLALLYEPGASGLLGIEEPENELHPQLLHRLAEELVMAAEHRQLLVATHSPAMLNALEPEQVWILHRGADGYSQATRVADLPGIAELVAEGSPLGYLWSRNFFEVGSPFTDTESANSQ